MWPRVPGPARSAVEVAERYTDGAATDDELSAAYDATGENHQRLIDLGTRDDAFWLSAYSWHASTVYSVQLFAGWNAASRRTIGAVLRDIFYPFGPAADQSWLTPNVVTLARTIYDERAFDRLPILADALMDAGCDNP